MRVPPGPVIVQSFQMLSERQLPLQALKFSAGGGAVPEKGCLGVRKVFWMASLEVTVVTNFISECSEDPCQKTL